MRIEDTDLAPVVAASGLPFGKSLPSAEADRWQWFEPEPLEWLPAVRSGFEEVTVVFYTYSPLGQESIYRHTDHYLRGQFHCRSDCRKIAVGPRQMVF